MSVVFEAHVVGKSESSIDLKVFIVNSQQFEFYESKSFALQLLWDSVVPAKRNETYITQVISLKKMFDSEWHRENEDVFIESISLLRTENYPILYEWHQMTEEEQDRFFLQKEKLATGFYRIAVKDKRLIDHLRIGDQWDSAAVDMSRY